MYSYLKSTDNLLHLGTSEIKEALNQIPVDESRGLLCLPLCVEGPPGATVKKNQYKAAEDRTLGTVSYILPQEQSTNIQCDVKKIE